MRLFLLQGMPNSNSPIGIFDSGLGGLSILSEIHKILPNENIIYYADSQNAPYGEKTTQEIVELSIKNTEFLLKKSCKIIVVGCNTATTNAIHILREKFDIPFIGIEPAIKPASIQSKSKQIGILATKGTLSSELFAQNLKKIRQNSDIIEVVGKGIVEAIENNTTQSPEFLKTLTIQLEPFIKSNIDHLVLGCSHYPLIINELKNIFERKVNIIDSGYAVAKQTLNILSSHRLLSHNKNIQKSILLYKNKTSDEALNNVIKRLQLKNIEVVNDY